MKHSNIYLPYGPRYFCVRDEKNVSHYITCDDCGSILECVYHNINNDISTSAWCLTCERQSIINKDTHKIKLTMSKVIIQVRTDLL